MKKLLMLLVVTVLGALLIRTSGHDLSHAQDVEEDPEEDPGDVDVPPPEMEEPEAEVPNKTVQVGDRLIEFHNDGSVTVRDYRERDYDILVEDDTGKTTIYGPLRAVPPVKVEARERQQ